MRLTPAVFWALSFKEWRALLAGRGRKAAPTLARAELERLMQLYPD